MTVCVTAGTAAGKAVIVGRIGTAESLQSGVIDAADAAETTIFILILVAGPATTTFPDSR